MAIGKRLKAGYGAVDRNTAYSVADAVKILKDHAKAKFDETVEVAMNLGVDPKHADQMVRGVVALPHGTGKSMRVAVFAKGDKAKEAQDAGPTSSAQRISPKRSTAARWTSIVSSRPRT